MIYQFRADDGSTLERDFPIGHAPKIGESLLQGRKVYRRVPSNIALPMVERTPHFVCDTLPRATRKPDGSWHSPYSKDVELDTGKPRFSHKREVKEAVAWSKHNDRESAVTFDG